ncbi:unnamed protein product [Vitrella brassicaformis CCMP3155]|uniref:Electron transfer flavoprotein alpha/beta-subunit N-terminal domain-containing protein n=2 Tax=Vitrella brassicaformis TaxID=1169539 RepID=A0A0G4GM98_VITBC|nr:unnamed protein product [Vitrella brassicaformis CCMP3155]|mmetsp:Transcript_31803/g.78886  ORF Transcript_31803/g.78886 Transcript_31803/m.78886 type:complete len:270 (+) Transcript_31803:69-878(+)|eukprot:CEM31309.1 unnamed protein product [Vitrella brassicaformis CCMP3155]
MLMRLAAARRACAVQHAGRGAVLWPPQQTAAGHRFFSTVVVAEHDTKKLVPSTLSAIRAALEMKEGDTHVLVAAQPGMARTVAEDASRVSGVKSVIVCEDNIFRYQRPDTMYKLLRKIRKSMTITHLVGSDSPAMLDIMPTCAKKLNGYYEYAITKYDREQLTKDIKLYLEDAWEFKYKDDPELQWIPTKPVVTKDMMLNTEPNILRCLSVDTTAYEPASMAGSPVPVEKFKSPFDHGEHNNPHWFGADWHGWLAGYTLMSLVWWCGVG